MSILSSSDTSTRAALDMAEALQHPHADLPYALLSDNTINALKKISDIFTNAAITKPTLPASSHPETPELPWVKTRDAGGYTRVEKL